MSTGPQAAECCRCWPSAPNESGYPSSRALSALGNLLNCWSQRKRALWVNGPRKGRNNWAAEAPVRVVHAEPAVHITGRYHSGLVFPLGSDFRVLLLAFLSAKQQSPPYQQARRTSGTSQNSNLRPKHTTLNSLAQKADSLGRGHCMDCSHGSMTLRNCNGIWERGTSPLQFHVRQDRRFTGMRWVNILQLWLRGTVLRRCGLVENNSRMCMCLLTATRTECGGIATEQPNSVAPLTVPEVQEQLPKCTLTSCWRTSCFTKSLLSQVARPFGQTLERTSLPCSSIASIDILPKKLALANDIMHMLPRLPPTNITMAGSGCCGIHD